MAYNAIYEVETCTPSGIPIRIILSKRDTSTPLVEKLGVLGFKIKGKKTDDIAEPINGSEITFTLLSSPTFTADLLTTEDEREWRTDVYRNGTLYWSGFNLPEGLDEPYSAERYNVTINANDTLGNLKSVPYSDGTPYIGLASDKDIIVKCLLKTGLDLPIVIGVNMRSSGMNTVDSPLAQSIINQARFLDKNAKPFSCHEVLRSILARYGAKLFQAEGAWHIINTLEQTQGPVKAWKYSATGVFIETLTISSILTAGPVNSDAPIIEETHNISKAKAFINSMAYYQYGFINNAIGNGNFNTLEGDFLKDWEKVGGVTAGVSTSTETNLETGEVVVTGHALRIYGSSDTLVSSVRSKTPIQVRANEKVNISFDLLTPADASHDYFKWTLALIITDNSGRYYTKDGWQQGPGTYQLTMGGSELGKNKILPVSFEIPGGSIDYQLTFAFTQLVFIFNDQQTKVDTRFDNLNITPAVSDEVLNPGLGTYIRLTQAKNLTYIPDPILLLHGDEPNNLRTSQILVNGSATVSWTRAGIVESLPLLLVVADSYLRLNSKPKKIFDATFSSTKLISPLTQFNISLINGSFHYLAGDFDLLKEEYNLSLFEGFNEPVNILQPYEFGVDTGNLKDGQGNSIGAPTGISNPPVFNIGGYIKNQPEYQENAEFNISKGTFKDTLVIPSSDEKLWKVYVDTAGTGGGGTPPTIVSSLWDLSNTLKSGSESNGQLLAFNSATGKWSNWTPNFTVDMSGFYSKSEVNNFFGGVTAITGYNKSNWDTAYGNSHTHTNKAFLDGITVGATVDIRATGMGNYTWNPVVKDTADYLFGRNAANEIAIISQAGVRALIGLGSNAYTSTAYLPLTGGILTGTTYHHGRIETYTVEAIRMYSDGAYISGYNTAGNIRNGYLQFAEGSLNIQSESESQIMQLNANGGNVGIGINNPSYKLHVKGSAGFGQNTNGTAMIDAYGGVAYFGNNSATNGLAINSDGTVTTSNALFVGSGRSSSYIYMEDVDDQRRAIHTNAGRIGFLYLNNTTWSAYAHLDGSWVVEGGKIIGLHSGGNGNSWTTAQVEAQGINPGISFHYPGVFGAPLWMDGAGLLHWDGSGLLVNGTISGGQMHIASEGTSSDPYGLMSITRGTGASYAYYGMTRAGQMGCAMGISTANEIIWGGGSALGAGGVITSVWASLNSAGLFIAPAIKAVNTLQIPSTSGKAWKIYVQDN